MVATVVGGVAQAKRNARIERWFGILAFSAVFLQKFGIDPVGIDSLILLGTLFWLFVMGDAVIDLTRFRLFTVLFSVCCFGVYLSGNFFSPLALMILFIMYANLLFRIDVDHSTLLRCLNKFQVCMVWIALIIILQQLVQYTFGSKYWPNLDALMPKDVLLSGFMYLRLVDWRLPYLVPQGVFGLEPSVFSGFLAAAAAAEIVWFKRTGRLALFTTAVLIGGAGTGVTALAMCSVPLFFKLAPFWRRWFIILGIPALIAVVASGGFSYYFDRSAEFSNQNSSAYERIVIPLKRISVEIVDPAYLLLGNGPGTAEKMTVPMQKVLYEYGLLAALVFHAYVLVSVMSQAPSRTVAGVAVIPHLLFGGGFVSHTNIMLLVMLGSLLRLEDLAFVELPIPSPTDAPPKSLAAHVP